MILSGAKAIVEVLKEQNVDIIFGYPGGVALPLYDALYDSGIRHVLPRHEQGAVHAADGYARVTGKPGVCIATSGPGATNLVTGIANAHMDSVPLVCITCQVVSELLGKDSFQEADIYDITTPITKHNFMVQEAAQLPAILAKAFYIATTGRPGPVLIDVPKDFLLTDIEYTVQQNVSMRGYTPLYEGNEGEIEKVVEALSWSQRPLFFIGGGLALSGMAAEFIALAEKTQIPVVSSLMGLGVLPSDNHLFLGMVGMHGLYAANMATTNCDLLIGLGVRFDDRVTGFVEKFAPNARIAHFDIDPSEINKILKCNYRVLADLRWSLPRFAAQANANGAVLDSWWEAIRCWQQEGPLQYQDDSQYMKPQALIEAVSKVIDADGYLVTDVGQHQMWTAQYAKVNKPHGLITSGGLGTMGYGLPAAIGVQLGQPDKEVWLISGDGSIMMNIQEIATAVEEQLPIKVVVSNNRGLGMVRQWQRMFFNQRYSCSKHEQAADIAKIARAFGATGIDVVTREELQPALAAAKAASGPVFINVRVDDDENVLPIVAPGAPIDKMIR